MKLAHQNDIFKVFLYLSIPLFPTFECIHSWLESTTSWAFNSSQWLWKMDCY